MSEITRIFICYRQVDGKAVAGWLYEQLQGHALPSDSAESIVRSLDVYYDQATPALGDWQALHRPSLESAHALLVVCTPGLLSRLGPEDWVHAEIDWWLTHRKVAPIIVDTTGEGTRWLPAALTKRWPNAQRLDLDLGKLMASPDEMRVRQTEMLVSRIIGGLVSSDTQVRFEELERQQALLTRQRRYLGYALLSLLATTIASLVAFWFSHVSQREAERSLANTLLQQANAAWEQDNEDFAKILSAEALLHDDSRRTRDATAAIHYWYDDTDKAQAIERFRKH